MILSCWPVNAPPPVPALGRPAAAHRCTPRWATRYLDITGCDVNAMEGPPELQSRRAGSGTTGSGRGSPRISPTTGSARGVLCATTRDGQNARAWVRHEAEQTRKLRDGGENDYADRAGLDFFWRRLVNGGASPGRAAGRAGRHNIPGHPHQMRPVPQAPVRPLDPGRLPVVREHRRGRSVRPPPRQPGRGRRAPG